MQVGACELCVVVEHLLEVGREPLAVGAVAMEAAAELVVHAPARHPGQGEGRRMEQWSRRLHGLHIPPQQEVHVHRLRKLGRAAEAALHLVQSAEHALHRAVQQAAVQGRVAGPQVRGAVERFGQSFARGEQLLAPVLPCLRDRHEELGEAGHVVARDGREVGAAVKGLALRGEKHGHRPSAAAGQRLHGLHVDRVDIGPFLAIDLDIDEQLVHERRDLGIFERFVRHDVAPVARGVADAQEDRLVLGCCAAERLRTPGMPVHRVVGVLQEIGAGLVDQPVGFGVVRVVGHERSLRSCTGYDSESTITGGK